MNVLNWINETIEIPLQSLGQCFKNKVFESLKQYKH